MDLQPGTAEHELESLTQFLYLAPIGLVQAASDGEILLLNPMAAQLLLPLAGDSGLVNLFDALLPVAPDLRLQADAYALPHGRVCDNLTLQVSTEGRDARVQTLSLTLLKLDATRLMAVIDDVTLAVRREAALRQSRDWIASFVSGRGDYALMSLDRAGRVRSWNAGVADVTGFAAADTLGRSIAIFGPAGAAPDDSVAARLAAARRDGWLLEEGRFQHADGSAHDGSALLVPADPAQPGDDAPAFSFVLRKATAAAAGESPDRV